MGKKIKEKLDSRSLGKRPSEGEEEEERVPKEDERLL